MDVAQMITSAVVPGAATLPASVESSSGASAAVSLFGEMFSKAASTAEFPGKMSGNVFVEQQSAAGQTPSPERLLMKAPGAELSAPLLAMFAGEALPVGGEQEMTVLPEGQLGTLLARAMAQRQVAGESAPAPEQRGLSLHKGRENRGEVKADLSEGQLEPELLAGAEILLTSDDSTRENKVEGSDSDGSTQVIPRQTSADDAGNPALAMLSAEVVSVPVSLPVERILPHGFAAETPGASTRPVLHETAAAVAHAVPESARGTFLAVPVVEGARLEQRPGGLEVAAEQLLKQAGNVAETVEKKAASLAQPESAGFKSFAAGTGVNTPAAETGFRPLTAEVAGTAKSVGPEIPVASPELKETVAVVPGGEKLVGKDHGTVVRHENGPALKQAQYEQNPAGKGESVLRELPSGVTVLNPAQTLTMGRPAITLTADAAPLAVQGTERGRIFPQEGETREDQGRQIAPAVEGEKIARTTEGFSSHNNSDFGHDSTSKGGNHAVPQAAAASGSFDVVAKGHLEPLSEVPRENEGSELHQNILSQVREKLVNQESAGNVSKITLKLNPHELGELQINVRLEDQKMRVDITAQNPVVKEALLQNIDQLKDTLMRQNISMERFHVSTGDGGQSFNQSFREGRHAGQQTADSFSYPRSGYYQEDARVTQAAYADTRENSLVDVRF